MKRFEWLIMVILLMSFTGCSHIQEYLEIAEDGAVSEAYYKVLNKWTREDAVYSEFETRVLIVGTCKDREFNEAYSEEYARIYHLTDAEKHEQTAHVTVSGADYLEFVFYAYIPDKKSNDFLRSNSIWKIFMIDKNQRKISPVDIREIKEITPLTVKFFPYVNKYYGKFYTVRFPALMTHDMERLQLFFTSVLGKAELIWEKE